MDIMFNVNCYICNKEILREKGVSSWVLGINGQRIIDTCDSCVGIETERTAAQIHAILCHKCANKIMTYANTLYYENNPL